MRTLLLLSLAATAVNALMPSEIVAPGGRVSNHSSASSSSPSPSFNNSSRACSGPDPEFFCSGDDLCIPMALRCDGTDDCSHGEDEIGCRPKCDKAHLFACASGDDCISKFWQCDGHADCIDGSDEVGCDPFLKKQHSCGASEFKCIESGICLPKIWYCDGERDCSHGEDEIDCRHTCNEKDLFACASGDECISKFWQCDGNIDCADGSDEVACDPLSTNNGSTHVKEVVPYPAKSMINGTTVADYDEEEYSTIRPNPSSIIEDIEDIGETCMSLRMENKELKEEINQMKAKVENLEMAITRVFEDVVKTD